MIWHEDYNFDICAIPVKTRKGNIDDNIYTLDIETTSLFLNEEGRIHGFNYSLDKHYYKNTERIGILYIWQLSINDTVIYGRTIPELALTLKKLQRVIQCRLIIYVHNLGFEFQFLRNIISDFEVFARMPYKPIYAVSKEFNIEFRCSYMLTHSALRELSKTYGLDTEKTTMDYTIVRLPCTPLTQAELEYAENDCLVLYKTIQKFHKEYNHIYKIPYTQTGRIRRVIKGYCTKDRGYMKFIKNRSPRELKEFQLLLSAFAGGYTHANACYTKQILEGVHSKDICSSYPTVMLCEKFPTGRFNKTDKIKKLEDIRPETNAYIIDITFKDLKSILFNNYLSKSKAIKDDDNAEIKCTYGITEDNGRIVIAESARFILTEIDIDIVKRAYKCESYTINECYITRKEYLRTPNLMAYICKLYCDKTSYKDVKEHAETYQRSKEFINALYGMCVTNLVRDDVIFDKVFEEIILPEQKWNIDRLKLKDIEPRLLKLIEDRDTLFLLYSWGIYITAYARRNLWDLIIPIDIDVVYSDTDSVKYVNPKLYEHLFDEYNKNIVKKLEIAFDYHNLPYELMKPKDRYGIERQIGIYEDEKPYDKFVTLGAKKYCYEYKGELYITVSGVKKETGRKQLKKIEDFQDGFVFDYKHSGRTIITYNDEQPEITVTDYLGNTETINQKYGINVMNTTYTLGISGIYDDYLTALANKSSTKISIFEGGHLQ